MTEMTVFPSSRRARLIEQPGPFKDKAKGSDPLIRPLVFQRDQGWADEKTSRSGRRLSISLSTKTGRESFWIHRMYLFRYTLQRSRDEFRERIGVPYDVRR